MAYGLTIGAVNLNSGDYKIINEYAPAPGSGVGTVIDRVVVLITASSVSNLASDISAINKEFTKAYERRRLNSGTRVYVTFTPDGSEDAYRSEIYSSNEIKHPGRAAINPRWRSPNVWVDQKTAYVTIDFERRAYWESTTPITLTLENTAGTGTIYCPSQAGDTYAASTISFDEDTRTIADADENLTDFNIGDIIVVRGTTHNDGTYTILTVSEDAIVVNEDALTDEAAGSSVSLWHMLNYVDVSETIIGDLLAPVKISYENDYSSAYGYGVLGIFAGIARGDHDALPVILQGEDGTSGALTTKTIVTGSGHSSTGEYARYIWAVDSEQDIVRWTIPASFAKASAGRYYKVLLVATAGVYPFDYNARFRVRLVFPGNYVTGKTPLFEGRQVNYGGVASLAAIDLGDVQLPPWYDDDDPAELLLVVTCEVAGGDDGGIDYVVLIPTTEYRSYGYVSDTLEEDETLVDDGAKDQVKITTDTGTSGFFTKSGSPLMLQPGERHRIFVQPNMGKLNYTAVRTMTITASYRPRYSTV